MVSYDDLSGGLKFTIGLVIVLLILTLAWSIALYYKDETSGFLNPSISEPRRATTMGGTAGLKWSEGGPVVHQNDYEMHHEAIKAEKRPSGVTIPGIAIQRGATLALRSARDGGDNGPQDFNY